MNYNILGSYIVSMSISLIIIWFAPLLIQITLQKIRKRKIRIRTIPLSIIILTIFQLTYTSIHILIYIPYTIAFHIFIMFFFCGLGISYFFRIYLIKKIH